MVNSEPVPQRRPAGEGNAVLDLAPLRELTHLALRETQSQRIAFDSELHRCRSSIACQSAIIALITRGAGYQTTRYLAREQPAAYSRGGMYRYDHIDRTLVTQRVEQFRDQTRRYLAGRALGG